MVPPTPANTRIASGPPTGSRQPGRSSTGRSLRVRDQGAQRLAVASATCFVGSLSSSRMPDCRTACSRLRRRDTSSLIGRLLRAEAREDLEERASGLAPLSAELRQLVACHDPTQLIPSISVPAGTGTFEQDVDDDSLRTFSNDAKIEYLAGLALAGPPGIEDVTASTTQQAVALISAVFDAAIAYVAIQPSQDLS